MAESDLQELDLLLERLCEGLLDEEGHTGKRLVELLDKSEACRRRYLDTLELHAALWMAGGSAVLSSEISRNAAETTPFSLNLNEPTESGPPRLGFLGSTFDGTIANFPQYAIFSYLMAAVLVGLGILVAALIPVSHPVPIANNPASPSRSAVDPKTEFVGQVTGMVDCRWSDSNTATLDRAYVPLGRKYALASGLMEITYDSGARVILQGPVTYEVESAAGGYLSVGKLTARLEKKAEKKVESGEWRVESTKQQAANPQSPIPNPLLSTLHSSLFTIKTPTATVTDLGTEFGVTVEPSGATETHVFQGRVEARLAGSAGDGPGTIRLEANQSARVDVEVDQQPAIRLTMANPTAFVRKLSKRVPIEVFNTGVGLKEGDPDPHWQLVAQSNDANFQPRPAIVVPTVSAWLANEPDRSQWISALPRHTAVPDGVTYTFRTTFELAGVRPETARLAGWFIVDNHVRAIRLNGHEVVVPKHEHDYLTFDLVHKFTVGQGFVDGTNQLEIDVENGKTAEEAESSLMGLRVTLETSAREE